MVKNSRSTKERGHISHQQYHISGKSGQNSTEVAVHGNRINRINNIRFADIYLIEGQIRGIQENVSILYRRESCNKTESLAFHWKENTISVEVDGEEIENVGEVVYLRGLLTLNDDCGKEMRSKNSKVSWSNGGFWNIRNS